MQLLVTNCEHVELVLRQVAEVHHDNVRTNFSGRLNKFKLWLQVTSHNRYGIESKSATRSVLCYHDFREKPGISDVHAQRNAHGQNFVLEDVVLASTKLFIVVSSVNLRALRDIR